MKAVAYIRVSTEEQTHGTSLDSQRDACVKYAKANGIELPKENIFREEGVSAKIMDRPQLAMMLDFCVKNKGKITHCIIWKVDRLARKSEYHHIIKAQLTKLGIKLVSVTEPIGDDPMGNLMDAMLAAFAQFDNEIRTARTTGGMRARLEQGGWPHAAPYGYRRARTPSGIVTIEPNEDAPKVKRLLEEFASGAYTVQQARELAFEAGIRTRDNRLRSWQIIKDCIGNPLYAGFVTSDYIKGQLLKGLHKPIVSESTYYRNKAILDGSITNYSKHAESEWPLRGGFLRHICRKEMTGSAPRGRSGPSPRYACPQCKAKVLKIPVSRARDAVHADFIRLLDQVRPSEPVQKLFKHIVLREWNNELKDSHRITRMLESEISALEDKKSKALDLFIEGKLTEMQKNNKIDEIDVELTKAQVRRAEVVHEVTDKEAIIDNALLFMSYPGKFWNIAPLEVKKRIQDTIFPEGLEYDCEKGFGTAKLAKSYLLIQEIAQKGDSNSTLVAATGIEPVTLGL
ncbi:recombinase family protein [Streptomyces caniscabiei]|uniref:recombinase family protein n=1 Tax=Streptomyces caniscabiei TaxID=2746961 RepID=UPI0038D465B1